MGATIDFGAGNENFTLSVGATNSSIHGGAGNDTFVVSASNLQTSTTVSGGTGNDSVSFTSDLSGGYVLGGSGNDTANVAGAVTTVASSVAMQARPPTFTGALTSAAVDGGVGGDSMVFSSTIPIAPSISVLTDTLTFTLEQPARPFLVGLGQTPLSSLLEPT